jgi:hypothetical protein
MAFELHPVTWALEMVSMGPAAKESMADGLSDLLLAAGGNTAVLLSLSWGQPGSVQAGLRELVIIQQYLVFQSGQRCRDATNLEL